MKNSLFGTQFHRNWWSRHISFEIFERFRQNYAKTAMKSFRLMFNEKLRFQVPRGT